MGHLKQAWPKHSQKGQRENSPRWKTGTLAPSCPRAELLAGRGVLEIFELARIPTCEAELRMCPCRGRFVVAAVANADSGFCECQRKKTTVSAKEKSHPRPGRDLQGRAHGPLR